MGTFLAVGCPRTHEPYHDAHLLVREITSINLSVFLFQDITFLPIFKEKPLKRQGYMILRSRFFFQYDGLIPAKGKKRSSLT